MYRARVVAAILLAAAATCIFWPSHQHKPVAAVTVAYITAPQHGQAAAPRQATAVTAAAAQRHYTIRPGDTLTAIALRNCPRSSDWTGLYAANRHKLGGNPDIIYPRVTITLDCYDPPGIAALAVADEPRRTAVVSAVASTSQGPRAPPSHAAVIYQNSSSGTYSYGGLEHLWVSAGGPSWAAAHAAEIAECESGGRTSAYNPSGATGLWQILGSVVPGNLYNAFVNALNAVSKFRASGDTFAQWVCQ